MTNYKKRIHSFSDDVLGERDAVEIARLLKSGELNTTEVIEATIKRANQVNPDINAVVYENYEKALESSKKDLNGFFAGVPIYFKDMTTIKGIPTTYGSEAFEGAKPAKKNDAMAKKILSMGFVTMGTSSMPEFGFSCSTEFPNLKNTLNPWHTAYTAGGSSGGAAALVSSGVLPMSHSADGGGSTRIPAACCGLVGLKPSRGRILLSKSMETQLLHIAIDGVLSRSVRDTAHFYHEAENYYYNKKLPKIGLITGPPKKKLNIGYSSLTPTGEPIDTANQLGFNQTIKRLEDLKHNVKPVNFPIDKQLVEDFKLLWASNGFGVKQFGKFMLPGPYNRDKLTKLTNGLSSYFAKRILQTPSMLYRLRKSHSEYEQFLNDNNIDVLLTPTLSHMTPKLGFLDINLDFETIFSRMASWACFTPFSNANGCPSISLPICHDEENDLPIGMLFWANHGQEKVLLELAYQFEEAYPWKKINS